MNTRHVSSMFSTDRQLSLQLSYDVQSMSLCHQVSVVQKLVYNSVKYSHNYYWYKLHSILTQYNLFYITQHCSLDN